MMPVSTAGPDDSSCRGDASVGGRKRDSLGARRFLDAAEADHLCVDIRASGRHGKSRLKFKFNKPAKGSVSLPAGWNKGGGPL
jgi:hypothetical protein